MYEIIIDNEVVEVVMYNDYFDALHYAIDEYFAEDFIINRVEEE